MSVAGSAAGAPPADNEQPTRNVDEFKICPFDDMHVIHFTRFVRHYLKCQKNHPNMQLKCCPFNATHFIKPEELKDHMSSCPNRRAIETDKYPSMLIPSPHGDLTMRPWRPIPRDPDEEVWD